MHNNILKLIMSSSSSSESDIDESEFSSSGGEEIKINTYSDKWNVLRGDLDKYHRELQKVGCRWTTNLRGGPGYLFNQEQLNNVKFILRDELVSISLTTNEENTKDDTVREHTREPRENTREPRESAYSSREIENIHILSNTLSQSILKNIHPMFQNFTGIVHFYCIVIILQLFTFFTLHALSK